MVELTNEDLQCINLFESLTGAIARDCLNTPEGIVFIISEGELGKAIGKSGRNINRVRTAFKKPVFIVENSEQLEKFIRNLFPDIEIREINVHEKMNEKIAYIDVDERNRGSAIGKGGSKIKLNLALLMRRFNCDLRLQSK